MLAQSELLTLIKLSGEKKDENTRENFLNYKIQFAVLLFFFDIQSYVSRRNFSFCPLFLCIFFFEEEMY